jgi:hypothetical protein
MEFRNSIDRNESFSTHWKQCLPAKAGESDNSPLLPQHLSGGSSLRDNPFLQREGSFRREGHYLHGQIPWNELSRISDRREVIDYIFGAW